MKGKIGIDLACRQHHRHRFHPRCPHPHPLFSPALFATPSSHFLSRSAFPVSQLSSCSHMQTRAWKLRRTCGYVVGRLAWICMRARVIASFLPYSMVDTCGGGTARGVRRDAWRGVASRSFDRRVWVCAINDTVPRQPGSRWMRSGVASCLELVGGWSESGGGVVAVWWSMAWWCIALAAQWRGDVALP